MCNRSSVSKTGLPVSLKREKKARLRRSSIELNLAKCAIAKPVQYSLRPFGGLFNPYSRGCSILCNHPGPNEMKTVLKQVKEHYIDGKSIYLNDQHTDINYNDLNVDPDKIPDDFFHRYTSSDSRPLTPAPTIVSNRTRTSTGSQLLQARRCLTPDPIKCFANERKQLVLDLRRSHSQETIFWNASSELSANAPEIVTKLLKIDKNLTVQSNMPLQKNMRLCEQEARKRSAEKKMQQQKEAELKSTTTAIVCINDRDDAEDELDSVKRRGKKKKKTKPSNSNTFHMSQEPETQIATLGPDSPNASARPSLVPNINNNNGAIGNSSNSNEQKRNGDNVYLSSSFITEDALKILRRGLNVDIVENAFERFMNVALKEALRTIPKEEIDAESLALRQFKETIGIENVDSEKWLVMPRKYTRISSRFGLPINTNDLAKLTPFAYISKHIWISAHRKQLYRYVFNKYLVDIDPIILLNADIESDPDDDLQANLNDSSNEECNKTFASIGHIECVMSFSKLDKALINVLGFYGTIDCITEEMAKFKAILLLNERDHKFINFRSWCGIVAFAERYLNNLPLSDDPCDEVEIADFETLERKFNSINVSDSLKVLLILLKYNKK